jgi:phage baseplate assembly protein W
MADQINKSFLGTGWSFPPSFNHHNSTFELVSEEDDIRQSLMLLIATAPGERIMNPAYGCDLNSLVFEPINDATCFEIISMVRMAILQFEPRVIVDEVVVHVASLEPGILHIQVDYTVIQTNSRSNFVYPFYLQEGTNIAV